MMEFVIADEIPEDCDTIRDCRGRIFFVSEMYR